jgi:cyanophycinase
MEDKYRCMKPIILFFVTLVLFSLLIPQDLNPAPNTSPSGKLVLVGGGSLPNDVRDYFIDLAGGKNARLLIVPSASKDSEILPRKTLMDFWANVKVAYVDVLHAHNSTEAKSVDFYKKIRSATGVWISGGDQGRLATLYRRTPVIEELKLLLMRGGVIGGTSAGASIAGEIMPYENDELTGFGLLDKFIIDQHFNTRHREERLKKLVKKHPGMLGVGVDEGTAIIVDNNKITVMGGGSVKLIGD